MSDHKATGENGRLNAFGRTLFAHPLIDQVEAHKDVSQHYVDGYGIPVDLRDDLG